MPNVARRMQPVWTSSVQMQMTNIADVFAVRDMMNFVKQKMPLTKR